MMLALAHVVASIHHPLRFSPLLILINFRDNLLNGAFQLFLYWIRILIVLLLNVVLLAPLVPRRQLRSFRLRLCR